MEYIVDDYLKNKDFEGKKYDALVIDSVNFFYRVCGNSFKIETPVSVKDTTVYLTSVKKFIESLEAIKERYGTSDCDVYLLFDNYFSRADLASSFIYADRKGLDENYKSNRKKENKTFYTSLNFIRAYYMSSFSNYHTIRITSLEADDLVEPLLNGRLKGKKCLMVTTDVDWCRYLGGAVDWLPDLGKNPETNKDLSLKLGFTLTKDNLIAFKALFGDESDNIPKIVPRTQENLEAFSRILKILKYPDHMVYLARDSSLYRDYPFLEDVNHSDSESYCNSKNHWAPGQYHINVQLVSAIPISEEVLEMHIENGREDMTKYHLIREAIGLEENSGHKFVFGGAKRPRVG